MRGAPAKAGVKCRRHAARAFYFTFRWRVIFMQCTSCIAPPTVPGVDWEAMLKIWKKREKQIGEEEQ